MGVLVETIRDGLNKRVSSSFENIRCGGSWRILLYSLDCNGGNNMSNSKVLVGEQDVVVIVPSGGSTHAPAGSSSSRGCAGGAWAARPSSPESVAMS